MIKKFTSFTGLRICLLLMSWITSTALLAQTKYSEGPDFPNAVSAATYTLNQAGEYTFSGRVETPGDPQDAFKVIIPTGFKITRAVLNASGGNTQQQPTGFVSFSDGTSPDYQAASFSNSSGVNVTRSGDLGPNTANNPYTGLASVDFSVGTTWSIKLTVVSTGTNVCTAPNVPTISATQTSICAGSSTSLSIQSGNLNDATAWKWYTGSCGGTPVGTGTSIQVSPTSTTTYYVRGEGGCVTAGSCASQQITVNPQPNAPGVQNVAYCQGVPASPLTATGINLKYYTTASGGTPSTSVTPSTSNVGMTTYYVSQTNDNGCESSRAAIIVTVNALPVVAITGLASAYCQDAGLITLSGTPANGSFTVDGTEASSFETANLTVGSHTVVYSYTNSNGCSKSTSQTFIIKATPTAPTLVTAGGQPFPEALVA
ncbi:hypothetical protein BWI93_06245 [Siphonobacter sp. BAB-5385]|uniref:immunoglobulin domain-containing protein n=1 Tax=Siphonobacter sp. BAB-5385 TaxID=1864822 RepID=UPI000B9EB5E3|nr:hypothetical protein [Siphonobacter sp. BAB-5385]OZI08999.1 hypothetical protein BWI93_06245 [Siphonobacter sp. BAB-5385]